MDLNEEIEALENTLARLKKQKAKEELKQWEPASGDWFVDRGGFVQKYSENRAQFNMSGFGLERPTKEQAEQAAIEMRKFNRLLSLRDELCGSVQWKNDGGFNFYVYYCHTLKKWRWTSFVSSEYIMPIFTEDAAIEACEILNDGHVIL